MTAVHNTPAGEVLTIFWDNDRNTEESIVITNPHFFFFLLTVPPSCLPLNLSVQLWYVSRFQWSPIALSRRLQENVVQNMTASEWNTNWFDIMVQAYTPSLWNLICLSFNTFSKSSQYYGPIAYVWPATRRCRFWLQGWKWHWKEEWGCLDLIRRRMYEVPVPQRLNHPSLPMLKQRCFAV